MESIETYKERVSAYNKFLNGQFFTNESIRVEIKETYLTKNKLIALIEPHKATNGTYIDIQKKYGYYGATKNRSRLIIEKFKKEEAHRFRLLLKNNKKFEDLFVYEPIEIEYEEESDRSHIFDT